MGSYRCTCPQGYVLAPNKRSCTGTLTSKIKINMLNAWFVNSHEYYIPITSFVLDIDIDECTEGGVSPCRGGPSSYCFNTRGGYKCTDVSCPEHYVPESGRKHRCRLKDQLRRCRVNDVACIRRPVSVSYNFLTLVSNVTIPSQGRSLLISIFNIDLQLRLWLNWAF